MNAAQRMCGADRAPRLRNDCKLATVRAVLVEEACGRAVFADLLILHHGDGAAGRCARAAVVVQTRGDVAGLTELTFVTDL